MKIEYDPQMPSRRVDAGLFLLRVGIGMSLLIAHGSQKLTEAGGFFFAGRPWGFLDLVRHFGFPTPTIFALCAVLGESVCALSVACGLFTRLSAGAAAITMLVAGYWCLKTGAPVESAYLYAIPLAVLTISGPGNFSIDHVIGSYKIPWPRKRVKFA